MAIVKASYTKSSGGAKASIRYIAHRPGKDGAKITRTLWGIDGKMERTEAYQMIDAAEKGSLFYRLVFSPDPAKEDTNKDLFLRDVTEQAMHTLEERFGQKLSWVAASHQDHAPHRHVHVIAVVPGKLYAADFQAMRQTATEAGLWQRQERDARKEAQQKKEQEAQWELQR